MGFADDAVGVFNDLDADMFQFAVIDKSAPEWQIVQLMDLNLIMLRAQHAAGVSGVLEFIGDVRLVDTKMLSNQPITTIEPILGQSVLPVGH